MIVRILVSHVLKYFAQKQPVDKDGVDAVKPGDQLEFEVEPDSIAEAKVSEGLVMAFRSSKFR